MRASDAGVSAIVLAGGRSARFGGNKLIADLAGRPVLDHALSRVASLADEVLVVVAPPDPARPLPPVPVAVRIVSDTAAHEGPLHGLRDGAEAARHATLLVVGGDMPALVPGVLRLLLDALDQGVEAAILGSSDGDAALRPLPMALTRGPALRHIAQLRRTDQRSLRALARSMAAIPVPAIRWRTLDPEGRTWWDIDRPDDLARIVESGAVRSSSD